MEKLPLPSPAREQLNSNNPEEVAQVLELAHWTELKELIRVKKVTVAYLKCVLGNALVLPEEVTAQDIAAFNAPRLNISFRDLEVLPSEIGKLTQLQSLELFGNKLSSLPPSIANLTKLHTLGLWYNQFKEVPKELFQLTNLTALDLFENQLESIPPEIGKLTKLTNLDLGNNQITHIPSSLKGLTQLKLLNLFMNPISKEEIARVEAMFPHCIVVYE